MLSFCLTFEDSVATICLEIDDYESTVEIGSRVDDESRGCALHIIRVNFTQEENVRKIAFGSLLLLVAAGEAQPRL